ncbi:hypothetical protein JCM10908_005827 [Rhodotorula pacifica]|uniref:uncharacterized protein n=1 Tax=Rhodotorula pacifica TaxID=1495444 RepID=UPI00316F9234
MSAFAVTLDKVLSELNRARSPSHPAPDSASSGSTANLVAHLERAIIRLERAYTALKDAGSHAPIELLIRLKGRAQELLEALLEQDAPSTTTTTTKDVAQLAQQVVEQIEQHLSAAAQTDGTPIPPQTSGGGRHSRTPSSSSISDFPRRVPASTQPEQSSATPQSSVSTPVSARLSPGPDNVDERTLRAHERAKELSNCYTLSRLAAGVLPAGKSLSSLLRATRNAEGSATSNAVADAEAEATSLSLEDRIKAQLRRAYFDSFRPIFSTRDSSRQAEQTAAWARLAQDLLDATLPLIPSRMRADLTLYPPAAPPSVSASVTSPPASMRSAVGSDMLSPLATENDHATLVEAEGIARLGRLVRVLQRLCAPARDGDVRLLLDTIKSSIHVLEAASPNGTAAAATAPSKLVDLVQQTLDLAEAMKADLDRFHTGVRTAMTDSMSDKDLREVIKDEQARRERTVVIQWYGSEEHVRQATWRWCSAVLMEALASDAAETDRSVSREDFVRALVEMLCSQQAVALPPLQDAGLDADSASTGLSTAPATQNRAPASQQQQEAPRHSRANVVPPPLVVLAPLLFELQNQLQAIVVLACLSVLVASVEPAASSATTAEQTGARDGLFRRLWTILDASIDRPRSPRHVSGDNLATISPEAALPDEATRLANLADEILAHLTSREPSGGGVEAQHVVVNSAALEQRVRSGVDRILRYEDPVWRLLSNRLKVGIETALLESIRFGRSGPAGQPQQIPSHLQTGRLRSSATSQPVSQASQTGLYKMQPIKGFEAPAFLADKVQDLAMQKLFGEVWVHVETVWCDVLNWNAV